VYLKTTHWYSCHTLNYLGRVEAPTSLSKTKQVTITNGEHQTFSKNGTTNITTNVLTFQVFFIIIPLSMKWIGIAKVYKYLGSPSKHSSHSCSFKNYTHQFIQLLHTPYDLHFIFLSCIIFFFFYIYDLSIGGSIILIGNLFCRNN